jgi:hypothetical protein
MVISIFRGHLRLGFLPIVLLSLCIASPGLYAAPTSPFLPAQGSTSPSNGDLNPYGLAMVPADFPGQTLMPGQLLVSNFNNSEAGGNLQGQGTTIVIIDPTTGQQKGFFFQGTGNPPNGFTNALGIVKAGFVFAGSVFTTKPDASDPTNGGLLVFDQEGKQQIPPPITSKINGPWGLAVNDQGRSAQLFVSNVLDGTVTRLNVSFNKGKVSVDSSVTIASGYAFGLDQAGLVVGPAGLAYDSQQDLLYVAAEGDNKIFVVGRASTTTTDGGMGKLVFDDSHLHGPLGLILAPNGHLITANADPTAHNDPTQPSELVEFTNSGEFVREFSIDSQQGGAFAILNVPSDTVDQFAYVDDVVSTITILRLSSHKFKLGE